MNSKAIRMENLIYFIGYKLQLKSEINCLFEHIQDEKQLKDC